MKNVLEYEKYLKFVREHELTTEEVLYLPSTVGAGLFCNFKNRKLYKMSHSLDSDRNLNIKSH